jgi:MFS family permease
VFTARAVASRARLKPAVVTLTIVERFPYVLFGVLALQLARLSSTQALIITFALLTLQGLGAGLTANFWQTMISRTMPPTRWGLFFGTQAAFGSLLGTGSAVAAGWILNDQPYPINFAVCFFLCAAAMSVSWVFLAATREPPDTDTPPAMSALTFRRQLWTILRVDGNFRWYLIGRWLQSIVVIPSAFVTVYAVKRFNADPALLGLLTGSLMVTQMVANPLMGMLGDRWGHRQAMIAGTVAAVIVPIVALQAPTVGWLFVIFVLTGISSVCFWLVGITFTLQFGSAKDRPAYVGLANTLTAPSGVLAPLLGGWAIDASGYPAMFILALVGGILAVAVLALAVHDPHQAPVSVPVEA